MTESSVHRPCCTPTRTSGRLERDWAKAHGPVAGTSLNQIEHQIVDIPGGKSLLGTDNPIFPADGEAPLRRTRIKPFRIDAATVTNARFRAFVEETGYRTEAESFGDSYVFIRFLSKDAPDTRAVVAAPWWRVVEGANWRCIFGPGSEPAWDPDHPVVHVTWNDAQAFALWSDGRLPTEAEWEHAARGGLGDVRFPWGDREPDDDEFFPCNIWQGRFPDQDLGRDGFTCTAPARSFDPNGYGLFNTVGNVWEWTSDSFSGQLQKNTGNKPHAGNADYKLTKGGSFLCHIGYCFRYRIAARTGTSPDSSTSHQGFRLVYDENS